MEEPANNVRTFLLICEARWEPVQLLVGLLLLADPQP
jgi:hypothetical protein